MKTRVVVTGMGAITPIGNDVESFWNGLKEKKVGIGPITHVMFGRNISLFSFIIASILTMIFALLVNFAMYYKLKNVQMVESLKSVD